MRETANKYKTGFFLVNDVPMRGDLGEQSVSLGFEVIIVLVSVWLKCICVDWC